MRAPASAFASSSSAASSSAASSSAPSSSAAAAAASSSVSGPARETEFDRLIASLPEGEIKAGDITALAARIAASGGALDGLSYRALTAAFSRKKRVISGATVLPIIKALLDARVAAGLMQADVTRQVWTGLLSRIVSLRSDGKGALVVKFDCRGSAAFEFNVPGIWSWVLTSRDPGNPFSAAAGSANSAEKEQSSPRTLIIAETVHFTLGDVGIKAVRQGDICVEQFFLTIPVAMEHVVIPNEVARDLLGRAYLTPTRDRKSALVDPATNEYVPVRADLWLKITAMGITFTAPVPRLPTAPAAAPS